MAVSGQNAFAVFSNTAVADPSATPFQLARAGTFALYIEDIPGENADKVAGAEYSGASCPGAYLASVAEASTETKGDVTVVDVTPVVATNGDGVVTGAGSTSGKPANQFTIASLLQSGTLTYSSGSKTFTGVVQCVNIVGKAATIVAVDGVTGQANRTMVKDNGATGDKLVNTLFDPNALAPKARAKAMACVEPDLAKLAASPDLAGDVIQISGATAPATT